MIARSPACATRQVESINLRHGVQVPLLLLNSFRTHQWTRRIVGKYRCARVPIKLLKQSFYPLLKKDTMLPLPTKPFEESSDEAWMWFPAGNGGVYGALSRSGALQELLDAGKKYVPEMLILPWYATQIPS